jgi:putative DNA primase/helicase
VIAQETSDGNRLNENQIKDLTGGDIITGKFLYGDTFQFKPGFTLIMYGNHKPMITGNDDGIKRRVVLIPWERQFKEGDPDRISGEVLKTRLRAEFSGILNWALIGLQRLRMNGWKFSISPSVEKATNEYFEENDRIGNFILDCLEYSHLEMDNRNSPEIYKAYQKYCIEEGMRPLSKPKFRNILVTKMIEGKKIIPFFEKGVFRGYQGLRINNEWQGIMKGF